MVNLKQQKILDSWVDKGCPGPTVEEQIMTFKKMNDAEKIRDLHDIARNVGLILPSLALTKIGIALNSVDAFISQGRSDGDACKIMAATTLIALIKESDDTFDLPLDQLNGSEGVMRKLCENVAEGDDAQSPYKPTLLEAICAVVERCPETLSADFTKVDTFKKSPNRQGWQFWKDSGEYTSVPVQKTTLKQTSTIGVLLALTSGFYYHPCGEGLVIRQQNSSLAPLAAVALERVLVASPDQILVAKAFPAYVGGHYWHNGAFKDGRCDPEAHERIMTNLRETIERAEQKNRNRIADEKAQTLEGQIATLEAHTPAVATLPAANPGTPTIDMPEAAERRLQLIVEMSQEMEGVCRRAIKAAQQGTVPTAADQHLAQVFDGMTRAHDQLIPAFPPPNVPNGSSYGGSSINP